MADCIAKPQLAKQRIKRKFMSRRGLVKSLATIAAYCTIGVLNFAVIVLPASHSSATFYPKIFGLSRSLRQQCRSKDLDNQATKASRSLADRHVLKGIATNEGLAAIHWYCTPDGGAKIARLRPTPVLYLPQIRMVADASARLFSYPYSQSSAVNLTIADSSKVESLDTDQLKVIARGAMLLVEALNKNSLHTSWVSYIPGRGYAAIFSEHDSEVIFGPPPFNRKIAKLLKIRANHADSLMRISRLELDYKSKAFIKLRSRW